MKLLKRNGIASDTRGAVIIELAVVAPVLALMTVGMVDMSNAFSRKLALEQGAHRAIEKIMQTTETSTVDATLTSEAVCQVNGTNADGTCKTAPITASNVTVTYRLECTNPSSGALTTQTQTDPDAFDQLVCTTGYKESRYVQVAITDRYTPLLPIHFGAYNSDGTYHLSATAGTRVQ